MQKRSTLTASKELTCVLMFPHRGLVRFFYSAHLTLRFYLRLCRASSVYLALFYTPCRAVACLYPSQFILPSGNLQLSRLGVLIGACWPLGDGNYCKKSRSNDLHTLLLLSCVYAQSYINMILLRKGEERTDIRPQMPIKASRANPIENELQKQKTR